MSDVNTRVIAEFRANRGHVDTAGFGRSLVLLHTTGRRTGRARVNPVLARRDGDDWLISASAGGAADHPDWLLNLRANPHTTIETGDEVVAVVAEELVGDDYATAWRGFVAQSAAFAAYQRRAGDRHIPVVRLRRRHAAPAATM